MVIGLYCINFPSWVSVLFFLSSSSCYYSQSRHLLEHWQLVLVGIILNSSLKRSLNNFLPPYPFKKDESVKKKKKSLVSKSQYNAKQTLNFFFFFIIFFLFNQLHIAFFFLLFFYLSLTILANCLFLFFFSWENIIFYS